MSSIRHRTRCQGGNTAWQAFRLAVLWLLSAALTACSRNDIEVEYGQRSGKSVNGTAAFAEMLRQSGFRVATWKRFSPKLEQADVLIWFAHDFEPPSADQRAFVERWLSTGSGRTLVYVGRDFDGASAYWGKVKDLAPDSQWEEVLRRYGHAKAKFDQERLATSAQSTRWFDVQPQDARYRPTKLEGPWSEDLDSSKLDLEFQTLLRPPAPASNPPQPEASPDKLTVIPPTIQPGPSQRKGAARPRQLSKTPASVTESRSTLDYSPLLSTDHGDVVAMEITEETAIYPHPSWQNGKIIVIANGSFLLNVALANHENRKLAARLVDHCGPPRRAVFLEAGDDGLPVISEEYDDQPNGFELFRVWPLNFILVHGFVLGILYCLARFPIFGRPRQLTQGAASDFGKHVTAVGELLEKTRKFSYARQLLAHYQSVKTKESR